jgi:putative dimethyl sulfoxide reductase chaperone
MNDYNPEVAAARADLCRLLAACYYQPGPEYAEEKVFDSMLKAAIRISPDLAACALLLGEEFSKAGQDRLLIDYTRLFLGPIQMLAKPYGSSWLEDETTLMQGSSVAVEELYEEGGFEMDAEFRELPDHIAAELEFLYVLLFRELQAHQQGDAEGLADIIGLRARFLDQHLGRWVGSFTAAVMKGAETNFYRELARLTERFIGMESRKAMSDE